MKIPLTHLIPLAYLTKRRSERMKPLCDLFLTSTVKKLSETPDENMALVLWIHRSGSHAG